MSLDDMDSIAQIDQASFPPLWQISAEYLKTAFQQASLATVAEYQGRLTAFQISTATSIGGHLARLAVDPAFHGRGIGYALLEDLMHQFVRHGAQTLTVNTQENNSASLALYKKAGFEFTGEKYPVYQFILS